MGRAAESVHAGAAEPAVDRQGSGSRTVPLDQGTVSGIARMVHGIRRISAHCDALAGEAGENAGCGPSVDGLSGIPGTAGLRVVHLRFMVSGRKNGDGSVSADRHRGAGARTNGRAGDDGGLDELCSPAVHGQSAQETESAGGASGAGRGRGGMGAGRKPQRPVRVLPAGPLRAAPLPAGSYAVPFDGRAGGSDPVRRHAGRRRAPEAAPRISAFFCWNRSCSIGAGTRRICIT